MMFSLSFVGGSISASGFGPGESISASGFGPGESISASGFGPGGPNPLGHRISLKLKSVLILSIPEVDLV